MPLLVNSIRIVRGSGREKKGQVKNSWEGPKLCKKKKNTFARKRSRIEDTRVAGRLGKQGPGNGYRGEREQGGRTQHT